MNITIIGSCFTTKDEINNLIAYGFILERIESKLSEDQIILKLKNNNCDILIIGGSSYITYNIIINTNVKYIFFAGTNFETSIEEKLLKSNLVEIYNAPYLNCYSVAELSIGLFMNAVLNLYTHFNNSYNYISNRSLRYDITSLSVGIIGLGHIGNIIAKILKNGFNIKKINYFSRHRKFDIEKEIKISYMNFTTILETSDVIFLTCSENNKTKNMISKKELQIMKHNAIIINTARPNLINGYDLYWALKNNIINSVSFDGYYIKPIPKSEQEDIYNLFEFINTKIFVTPYIGSASVTSREKIDKYIAHNILLLNAKRI